MTREATTQVADTSWYLQGAWPSKKSRKWAPASQNRGDHSNEFEMVEYVEFVHDQD